jgi:predicted DNA-binding WGR domain protein
MLKLYKLGDMTRYWEAWNTDTEVTIHWGIVGETGETRDIPLRSGENPNSIIKREAKQPKNEGYRKIPPSKSFRLVIQFRVDGMGSTIDLEKRIRVENLMSECLGWRGLGLRWRRSRKWDDEHLQLRRRCHQGAAAGGARTEDKRSG